MTPISQAHAALRDATARHHAAAEDALAAFDLGTREGYAGFLLAQALAVLPIEHWLAGTTVTGALPDWAARRRGPMLLHDLDALGASRPAWSPAGLPGDALGAVYVLEGSRFGGRLLARRAAGGEATRFLLHPGVPGGWRVFWDAVERELAARRRSLAAMVEAAEAAFALFSAAVIRVAPPRPALTNAGPW